MVRKYELINDLISPYTKMKINNDFKYLFENLEKQGKSIQDLVADGQLTPTQYAELLVAINSLLKSGNVNLFDLSEELRNEIKKINNKIDKGSVGVQDLNPGLNNEIFKISNKIDKGQVTADDFNKNGRLLDSTFFTTSFLNQLNNSTIEVTNLLDDSVENRHLVNGAVDYENISDDGIKGINLENAIREFFGVSKNLILNPPGEIHLTTYAAQVEDIYYHSLISGSAPSGSMTDDKKITLPAQTGYFFYRIKVVGELLNKRVVSFIVQNSNPDATIGIRFLDGSFTPIGSVIYADRKINGIYGFENIPIPSNSATIEFRADNRGNDKNAIITNPIVVASPRINLRDGYINDLEKYIEKVETDLEKYKIDDADKMPPIRVKTPVNFSLKNTEINDRIYTDGLNSYMTDYDVSESKMNIGQTYYVDFENGVNTADGLTPQTPFKTYAQAITRADVGEIKLKGGNHYRYNAALPAVSKNLNITSYDGIARLIATDKPDWIKTSGYNNVYQTNAKFTTRKVIDLDILDGDGYLEFDEVDTIAEVNSTENTFCTIDGVTYSHAKNAPGNNQLIPLFSNQNILTTNDITYLYLEGIEVIGGARPVRTVADDVKFYAKNCKFIHGLQVNGNGLEIVGGVSSICQNVITSKNPMDGFNYHIGVNGKLPYFIEINCFGVDNGQFKGTAGSRSDNGSTTHDGIKGIRLNGYYGENDGGNIADVNKGSETWNMNTKVFNSYQGYDIIVNGGAKIFLDNVTAIGSETSIISQDVNDEIYIRGGRFGNMDISGTVINY